MKLHEYLKCNIPITFVSHRLCLTYTTAIDTLLHIRYKYRNSSVRYFVHFCFCSVHTIYLPSVICLFLCLSHSMSFCDIWMSYIPFLHIRSCFGTFVIILLINPVSFRNVVILLNVMAKQSLNPENCSYT